MADDAAEQAKSLPLPDRFAHKVWKVRKEGYEDAAKLFKMAEYGPEDPVFRPFVSDPNLMKGAVGDSNVAAQQEGLGALCELLRYGPKEATRTKGATVPLIIEKGLPSTRAGVKQNALEALMLYVEVDNKADQIVEEFIPILSHKQPKVIAAALSGLTSLYHAYGVKIVDPKPILKNFPKPFAHADKNVRAEATKLAVEIYRWLKDVMKKPFWGEIKELQQKELEKEFEAVNNEAPPQQERLTRSQQDAPPPTESAGAGDEAQDADQPDEDDFADLGWEDAPQVDVLSKMPSDFNERMSSTKWKDRKEALDDLHKVANVTRIKEGPYDELVSVLAKCMKDANIMVVITAANCVEDLANGLKRGFAKYRSRIMNPMMERLKEKKQSVADALGNAMDAVFMATALSDCLDDILEFLKHKNPAVKEQTMRFLIRCLRTTREAPGQPEVKAIAEASTKLMTESVETLRNGGSEAMGTLMKIMGERIMTPFMEGLDDIRKAKVKEYFETAEVKAKAKPKPQAKPPPGKAAPARAAPPAQKTVAKRTAAAPVVKKPAPKPATPEPAAVPSPAKAAPRAGPASKLGGPGKSGLAPPAGKLGLQKKLAGPSGSVPSSGATSPQRKVSPQSDEGVAPAAAPKTGLGRGLAGRSLAKPAVAPAAPVAPPAPPGPSALELAELEDLRNEKERLLAMTDELRKEKAQAELEINELRTHEAELIEERTRNRLTIKAKETQLVRARSDAEVAEETVGRQQREIDRLKRELSRAVRGAMTSPPPPDDGILADAAAAASAARTMKANHRETSFSGGPGSITPRDVDRYESNRASREVGYQRARNYMTSPSDEKENGGVVGVRKGSGSHASPARRPQPGEPEPAQQDGQGGQQQPIESWRRAAEVTSQLKARIEMMKARQGLGR